MRILVTGSRDWPYPEAVCQELKRARGNSRGGMVVVEGACPSGADEFAFQWVEDMRYAGNDDVASERHPAEWEKHGKAAGPLRNQEMVDLGADLCIAFSLNQSRGTADCVNRALSAGIPCRVLDLRIR